MAWGRPTAGLAWHRTLAEPAAMKLAAAGGGAVGVVQSGKKSLDKCIPKRLRLHTTCDWPLVVQRGSRGRR